MSRYDDYYFAPYVSVGEKKVRNARMIQTLATPDRPLQPVVITGSKIAKSFWGKAWCDNVESYQDYSNRLPRGRSYVRCGAVIDLRISPGRIDALVAGSDSRPYVIGIDIKPLESSRWEALKRKCVGKISSLVTLAQGRLPPEVLTEFCDRGTGLFPAPGELKTRCSCPDWAGLCKHLAAVLYGVGARLDQEPKLFFVLRGIDPDELIGSGVVDELTGGVAPEIAPDAIAGVFGMEFDSLDDVKTPDALSATVDDATWPPERVAALRARRRETQREFGIRCAVSNVMVSNWERGRTPVGTEFGRKLAQLERDTPPGTPKIPEAPKAAPAVPKSLSIPELITLLRQKHTLTQTALARKLKVSTPTIGNWERGKTVPGLAMQRKLKKLL